MNKLKNLTTFQKIIASVLVLFGIGTGAVQLGGGYGKTSEACDVTITTATVGDDLSSTVLSAASLRAWARIQVPRNATNTVALSFDEGEAATLATGILLNTTFGIGGTAGAGTSTPFIDFGLNTDFPYTGAVTAITSGSSSSTVTVTECKY